jgi:three-Cys-motif partner protein
MSELYEGREQSRVKHIVLQKYLERFAIIIGMARAQAITYVDCFSGPWNVRSPELADSSFATTLRELRKAQAICHDRGKDIRLRCFFLEENERAYADLARFAERVKDQAEIETRNAKLSHSVAQILSFIRRSSPQSFPFIFLDPTGWTGLELDAIKPLLQLNPGEVLVNFMTSHIRRFIRSPQPKTQESFERVYGPFKPSIAELQGLQAEDLDDALVEAYARLLREVGRFPYICKAIVLDPEIDSTNFHLVYATRNPKGVEVFKEAERSAMNVQQSARAEAKSRKRVRQGQGQSELFSPQQMDDPRHYLDLCKRYGGRAKTRVVDAIKSKRAVSFDELWLIALSEPIVQEVDLREWLREWQTSGQITISGMTQRQRVPRRGQGILVSETSHGSLKPG